MTKIDQSFQKLAEDAESGQKSQKLPKIAIEMYQNIITCDECAPFILRKESKKL